MFEVSVTATFSAAHRVRIGGGDLEPIHGHDWQVTATFRRETLDRDGVVVDFVAAERCLHEAVGRLHHSDLNACPAMRGLNPSAENVARVIYEIVAEDRLLRGPLHRVRVTEAPGCVASYIAPRGSRA